MITQYQVHKTTNQELAQYAEKAAEIVEQGWCKYTRDDHQGNYCALGALGKATIRYAASTSIRADLPDYYELARKAASVIAASGFSGETHALSWLTHDERLRLNDEWLVADYNNHPDRTQAEIVDLLKTVAKEFSNEVDTSEVSNASEINTPDEVTPAT